jgi:hypothetical protein
MQDIIIITAITVSPFVTIVTFVKSSQTVIEIATVSTDIHHIIIMKGVTLVTLVKFAKDITTLLFTVYLVIKDIIIIKTIVIVVTFVNI